MGIIAAIDSNADGKIQSYEFRDLLIELDLYQSLGLIDPKAPTSRKQDFQQRIIYSLFQKFDKDMSNTIDKEEAKAMIDWLAELDMKRILESPLAQGTQITGLASQAE